MQCPVILQYLMFKYAIFKNFIYRKSNYTKFYTRNEPTAQESTSVSPT